MGRQERRGQWLALLCPTHTVDLNHVSPMLPPAIAMNQQTESSFQVHFNQLLSWLPFLMMSLSLHGLWNSSPAGDVAAALCQAAFLGCCSCGTQHFRPWIAPLLECKLFRLGTMSDCSSPSSTSHSSWHMRASCRMSPWLSVHEDERKDHRDNFGIVRGWWWLQWWCHPRDQEFCLRPVECKLIIEPTKGNWIQVSGFRRKVRIWVEGLNSWATRKIQSRKSWGSHP